MSDPAEQPPFDVLRRADGQPVLTLPSPWSGLPVSLHAIPAAAEFTTHVTRWPTLLLARYGHGERWYQIGPRTYHLRTAPGMIELYPAGLAFERLRWSGETGECIAIQLAPPAARALAPHTADLDFVRGHELFDERLAWLAGELVSQASQAIIDPAVDPPADPPVDPLYVEGLSLALLGRLQQRGWIARLPAAGGRKLDPAARRRVLDLIAESLHEDLSIARLATRARMSPDHFAHCFKATFGVSPHRYVQAQRVAHAKQLLRSPSLSIAEIAMRAGFASQSHFTEVFRQHTGTTPGRWRRS